MYIAIQWLLSMALAMWITLCLIDYYKKDAVNKILPEFKTQEEILPLLKNSSTTIQQTKFESTEKFTDSFRYNESIFLQYVMFIAGACMVLIYNRKNYLILYTNRKFKTLIKNKIIKMLHRIISLKKAAKRDSIAIWKILKSSMGIIKNRISLIFQRQSRRMPQNINLLLLNKLKEYGQERKNLGHLLIAAIQENKNIRMRYQLETLAKKRLVRNIEDTQKQMKESRSRYVSFQQLYLITHQENIFLKSRIKKLTEDKEDAERNLLKLINHVWQSKNNELKAYCSRFIVSSKNNLLNSDVRAEIDQFLKISSRTKQLVSDHRHNQMPFSSTHNLINEIVDEEKLIAVFKDAPKLRGLPGEYVWTIKDKDGMIEKLYEYESDFDNGDTIRRIREYSVYYDKDCLLDFSSSTTFVRNENIRNSQYKNTRRITGSEAFQKFLQNNKNIVLPRRLPPPPPITY